MSEADQDGLNRVWFDVPGGRMAGIQWGAPKPTPDIVFLHATGFNARTYRTLLAPLGERFHVLALDARGHGRTELSARMLGYTSWARHRDDLIAVLEHFRSPVTLAGHSMGATVSLLAAGRRTDLVCGLALIDPVILSASSYAVAQLPAGSLLIGRSPLARGARRRRETFPSRQAAIEAFTGRGAFKSFSPETLADYVGDGLVEDGAGGFKLACARRYEAATFAAHRHDPWDAVRRITDPIVLLRAERHATISEAAMYRVSALNANARVATVEGASHMIPMDRPDRVRSAIETAHLLARNGRNYHDASLE